MPISFIVICALISFSIAIICIIGQWKAFEKAGQPGWACLIPIYNVYILLKIGGKPSWWLLLFFIPLVNVVYAIWLTNMISKSFGKDESFTVGLIALGVIFWPILGYGNAVYRGPFGDPVAYEAYQRTHFNTQGDDNSLL
jgi:hypothetical protein